MDSGNSGSMQSSSGDEEYDSRSESSLPTFLNHSGHFGLPLSLNPQSFLPQQQHHHPTLFDPSSNLFHAFSQSSPNPNLNSSLLNLDVVRTRGLRSDSDCTDLGRNLPGSSPAVATGGSNQSSILGVQGSGQGATTVPSMQLRSVQDNGARSSPPSDQMHAVARNPKKRTRASRRAPTTVLTTDTSNFRAMVQEFTGIPAPPFSGSPYSRRLDLFGSVGSGMRSSQLEQMGSLPPLRLSSQKLQHQPSPFSFSNSPPLLNNNIVDATNTDSTATTTATGNNSSNTITSSSSITAAATTRTFNPSSVINYQVPSDLGQLSKQSQNMLNMQNQMLSFQSLLQPPPLHNSVNVPGLGAKSQGLPLPSLDELGMNHGHVNVNLGGIQSHNMSSTAEGMRLRNDHNSCKLNYSASSSDFHHHDKGLQNIPPRGEGAVDSWIFPSE